jgi:hypothetical protein
MPQYYFHVTDGHCTYNDDNGSLHLSSTDAYTQALRIAGELASDDARAYTGFIVCVVDQDGNEVARVAIDGNAD